MPEYFVKIRVEDPDDEGKDKIKEMFQQFFDKMLGNAPFGLELEEITNADPRLLKTLIEDAICPHCKTPDALNEDEVGIDYKYLLCSNCNASISIQYDMEGIEDIVMMWEDDEGEEYEKVLYDKYDRYKK